MRRSLILVLLFLGVAVAEEDEGLDLAAPDPAVRDAVVLAQGSGERGVLSREAVAEIHAALARVRVRVPAVREIHARPDYELTSLLLKLGPRAQAPEAREALDALHRSQGGRMSRLGPDFWIVRFETPRDIATLVPCYAALPAVEHAEPNTYVGDGDDVTLLRKGSTWHFVFRRGWGDCPSGCIHNEYRYVTLEPASGAVTEVAMLGADEAPEGSPLWGIPARFTVRTFAGWDELVAAAQDERWWVVLHAAKVLGYLLQGPASPMYGEDLVPEGRFARVRDAVVANRHDALTLLVDALDHPDPDVVTAAHQALLANSDRTFGVDAEGRAAWRTWLEAR
ncbi:MAG: hypothetical protein ACYTG6_07045 [Planctomycetota bacterium]|jgi:hypothetical protein